MLKNSKSDDPGDPQSVPSLGWNNRKTVLWLGW